MEDNIYSTVPVDTPESDLHDRKSILQVIKDSDESPITAKQISEEAEISDKGTCPKIRRAITDLIELDGEPIVAVSKGFLYAKHPNQLMHYARELENRMQGLDRRIRAVRSNAARMNVDREEPAVLTNSTKELLRRAISKASSLMNENVGHYGKSAEMLVREAENSLRMNDGEITMYGYLIKIEKVFELETITI